MLIEFLRLRAVIQLQKLSCTLKLLRVFIYVLIRGGYHICCLTFFRGQGIICFDSEPAEMDHMGFTAIEIIVGHFFVNLLIWLTI